MSNYKKRAILFLTSQAITLFGSSIVQFAIIWYVTLKTSSGSWVSALTIAAYAPQFVISFFAGVWADRFPRKWMILLSDLVIAASTLGLAIMMPFIRPDSVLLIVLLLISVIRSIGTGIQTPAVNAAIPQLVPEEALMKFNGFNSGIQAAVQFVAPIVAGAVLSIGTIRQTLFIDIVTAVVGCTLLLFVKIPFERKENSASVFSEMKEGVKYATENRIVGSTLVIFGMFIFLGIPAGFLATLFTERYFGTQYWYLTAIEVAGFMGMAAGGMLIGAWGGFKNRVKTLVVGLVFFGMLAIGMGLAPDFKIYLILMAVYGIAITMVQTACMTLLQENTTQEMQGRVFGLFQAAFSGMLPIGMALFGPMADVISLRLMMTGSGAALVILAILSIKLHLSIQNINRCSSVEL